MINREDYLNYKKLVQEFENFLFEFVKNKPENKYRASFMKGVSLKCDEINKIYHVTMSINLDRSGVINKIYKIGYDELYNNTSI